MAATTRIGIVDMGSNAIRFQVMETTDSGPGNGPTGAPLRTIHSNRLAVRLGQSVFLEGAIPEPIITRIAESFCEFVATCKGLGAASVRAIATSAMRDAQNADALRDRVRRESGVEIEIISGEQEAAYLKRGIETRCDLSRGRSLLADVGGGSVELVVVDDGEVQSSDSHDFGAVRLLHALGTSEGGGALVDKLREHLQCHDANISKRLGSRAVDRFLAVGGNIDCLVDLVAKRTGAIQQHGIDACSIDELEREIRDLAELSVDERMQQRKLRPDRADAIVPAGAIYLHIARLANAAHVLVPRTGIKDGLMASIADDLAR